MAAAKEVYRATWVSDASGIDPIMAELVLQRAHRLMDERVFSRHGVWVRRDFQRDNAKIKIPADLVTEEFLRKHRAVRVAMPKSQDQLDAAVVLMGEAFRAGRAIAICYFKGDEDE